MSDEVYLYDEDYSPTDDMESTRWLLFAIPLIFVVAFVVFWRLTEPPPLNVTFTPPPIYAYPSGLTTINGSNQVVCYGYVDQNGHEIKSCTLMRVNKF